VIVADYFEGHVAKHVAYFPTLTAESWTMLVREYLRGSYMAAHGGDDTVSGEQVRLMTQGLLAAIAILLGADDEVAAVTLAALVDQTAVEFLAGIFDEGLDEEDVAVFGLANTLGRLA
jgi:hypothetical protein